MAKIEQYSSTDNKPCTKVVHQGSNAGHAETQRRNLTIHYLHATGKSNTEIAKILKIHRNTVSAVVKDAPPSSEEMATTLERLDSKAMEKLETALDSRKYEEWWDAVKFYLGRRSVLGEQAPTGPIVNITVIQEKLAENRAAGFAAYGLERVPLAGDN